MALLLLVVFILTSATNSVAATNDVTAFVHKTCSNNQTLQNQFNQTLQNHTLQNQTLDTLFTALVSLSSTTNFFKTTINNVTGLYQCRNDISHSKCKTCVQTLKKTIQTSCSTARAQLVGCYMWYEVNVYHVDYPPNGLWYKKCVVRAGTGTYFEVYMNEALNELVDSIGNTKGYFARRYSWKYDDASFMLLGQCENDLGDDECVDCMKTAVDFAQVNCSYSSTGDICLQKCYISYSDGGDMLNVDGGDDDGENAGGLLALIVAATVVSVLLLHPTKNRKL